MVNNEKMKIEKKCLNTKALFGMIILLSSISVFRLGHQLMMEERRLSDFCSRWKESAYLLKGFVPTRITETLIIPEIGVIDDGMVSTPWTWAMGIVVNFAFLPWSYAKVCNLIMQIACIVGAMIAIYLYMKSNDIDKSFCYVAPLLLLCNCESFSHSLGDGNNGAMLGCLVIIAICLVDRYPLIAGLLMSITLMKPQIGGLFMLALLINKKFKSVISGIFSLSFSMAFVSMRVGMSPMRLIIDELARGTKLSESYYMGILDPFKKFYLTDAQVIIGGMLVGIIFVSAYTIIITKYSSNIFHVYSGAAIASCFWSYKNNHDLVVLAIPAIAFLILVDSKKELRVLDIMGIFFFGCYVDIFYTLLNCIKFDWGGIHPKRICI